METFLTLLPYLLSVFVSAAVGIFCWGRRVENGAQVYALIAFSQASWTIGFVLEMLSPDLQGKVFWDSFQCISAGGWMIAFVAFTHRYSGQNLKKPVLFYFLLSVPNIIYVIISFTDSFQEIVRPNQQLVAGQLNTALIYDFSITILTWGIYNYIIFLIYLIKIAAKYLKTHSIYRTQIGLVLAGNIIPFLGTIFTITILSELAYRDITPFTFAAGNLIVTWGLFRHRLFDVVPLARDIIVENIQDAVVVLDAKNRVIDLNEAAMKSAGFKGREVIGKPAQEIFSEWSDLVMRFKNTKAERTEINAKTSLGLRQFELRVQPVYDKRMRFKGRVFITRDITEIKKAENELRQHRDHLEELVAERTAELTETTQKLNKQLEEQKRLENQLHQSQKMEAIGLFAGGIAHDFNNLLTAILGNADIGLLDLKPSDKVFKNLLDIKKVSFRASDLINKLLSFSRRQVLQKRNIDVNEQIVDILTMIRRILREDIDLITDFTKESTVIFGDPGQLEQILINLCTNGRDAMQSGGKLTIRTEKVSAESVKKSFMDNKVHTDYVLISVSDTGSGINEETKLRIFDPFFTTKEVSKGTGLGLSVVYGIVKQHNGYIKVESQVEQGTTFKIYFPLSMFKKSDGEKTPAQVTTGGNETILLVEDDEVVCDVTTRILNVLGYKVLATNDPCEALIIYEKQHGKIDLLITDVVMPGYSGPEIYSKMTEINPDLPVLFVTGYEMDHRLDSLNNIRKKHESYILKKPFTKDTLDQKIRILLEKENIRS